jgi:hypothetical protein
MRRAAAVIIPAGAIVVALAWAVIAIERASPNGHPDDLGAAIEFVGYRTSTPDGDEANVAVFRMTNRSTRPLFYTGYGAQHPIWQRALRRGGQWGQEGRILFCGTGLEQQRLDPGQSREFDVRIEPGTESMRVSVAFYHGAVKPVVVRAWSEASPPLAVRVASAR